MTSILKAKVLEYVTNQRRSVRDLERQAGLNYNAIHNILSDRSKSPSIDTVLKIAEAIGCSVDEMLGRTQFLNINKDYVTHEDDIVLDKKLFESVCSYMSNFVDINNLNTLTLSQAIFCIQEIYKYCSNTESKTFDEKFAHWFLQQKLTKIL